MILVNYIINALVTANLCSIILPLNQETVRFKAFNLCVTDSQLPRPVTTALPQHFFTLGNDSYKVQMEKMSWDEARRQCKADDADLASVLDSISQAYTILRVSKLKEPLWIGLNSNLVQNHI